MLGSSVLEIIITLVFVYFLMSLVCSVAAQLVSSTLQLRSANLFQGLSSLMHDPNGKVLMNDVFKHYAIASLTKKKWYHRAFFFTSWLLGLPFRLLFSIPCGACLPQYIPPKSLSRAMIETVRQKQVLIDEHLARDTLVKQKPNPWDLILSLIKTPLPLMPVTPVHSSQPSPAAESEAEPIPFDSDPEVQSESETGTEREVFPNDVINPPRATTVESWAQQSMPALEEWFKDSIPLISDWYKLWMRLIILFFAVALTIGINADTLMIANELRNEQIHRSTAETTDTPYIPSLNRLEDLFGWSNQPGHGVPQNFKGWIMKIVGLLITLLAVAQGSPFWFDLFRRLVDSRSAGRPHPIS